MSVKWGQFYGGYKMFYHVTTLTNDSVSRLFDYLMYELVFQNDNIYRGSHFRIDCYKSNDCGGKSKWKGPVYSPISP